MKSRSNTFIQRFLIYSVGHLGSKFINLLLFPIFSFYIIPKEMGIYDISIVLIYLFIPIFTLNTKDSSIRFLIDPELKNQQDEVIRFILRNMLNGAFIASFAFTLINIFFPIPNFGWILITFISILFFEILIQIVRGTENPKLFVTAGIINTFFTALISIVLVVYFKYDIRAVYFATIVSRLICIVLINHRLKLTPYFFKLKEIGKETKRNVLRYAIPLLPNFILFWIIDNFSKIVIINYLGAEFNGLYAIIIKFSSILLTFANIFHQTWQEQAIKYYHSPDRDYFFSKVFNRYFLGLSLAVMAIGFGTKTIYPFIVDKNYHAGVVYIYPLLVSVLFYALAFFLEMSYQCSKQSKRALPSIISTAILSIVLNLILIKPFGIMGVTYSLVISYSFLTIFRFIDSRSLIPIKINWESILAITLLITGWVINDKVQDIKILSAIAVLAALSFALLYAPRAILHIKHTKASL